MVKWDAEGAELGFVPTGADAENEAALADFVYGGGHLRQYRGVPKLVAEHERAQLDAVGRVREGRKHRPAFPNSACRLSGVAVEEMIVEPNRIEPGVFR